MTSEQLAKTILLGHVAPWAGAIFGQARALDLAADVTAVRDSSTSTPLAEALRDIDPLDDSLPTEAHVYQWSVPVPLLRRALSRRPEGE